MQRVPEDFVSHHRSPEFDETSLPAGLQRQHQTKTGTWALIHVLEGRLKYRILDPVSEVVLEPGKPGVVAPQQLHEVEVVGPVRMYVEFFVQPEPASG